MATPPDRPLNIAFSFPRGRGHLAPLLPIARHAEAVGHHTALIGAREPVLEQSGFTRLCPRDITLPSSTVGTGSMRPFDSKRVLQKVEEVFLGTAAYGALIDVHQLLTEWPSDILVCSEFDFGAMTAAEEAGLPCVVVTAFATASNSWKDSIRVPIQQLRFAAGLAPDPHLTMLDGALTVVPATASMRPDSDFGGSVMRLRPTPVEIAAPHPAAEWFRAGDEAIRIYVTLGTEFNTSSGGLFGRLLEAVAELPARILVTTGPWVDPRTFEPGERHGPSSIRVEQYVPQAELMQHADLVVNHGGSSSVVGALDSGVPMIVLPLGADQVPNGNYVEAAGAGAMPNAESATSAEIRAVAEHILSTATYRSAARAIGAQLRSLPTVGEVMTAIEGLAASARPAEAAPPTDLNSMEPNTRA
ncbi:glycosyltransferase family 1 protein [Agreia pratensis]|uniref:glycosyltransferase n=1 Tax=Agreia pratensis TaxID=150121 RepID=UPI00188C21AB|nr:glycosyltransferase [Agreia pratensis]MBF4636045.1 glycosyltransferase family 1 protein [Agreia pratensis]